MTSTGYINQARTTFWGTPKNIMDNYTSFFDPCPFPRPDWDGLAVDWLEKEKIYVNPPYNNIKPWAKKCVDTLEAARKDNMPVKIHLLVPVRTDTSYFHEYIYPYCKIHFIKGRLKFIDLTGSSNKPTYAPFPNMICVYSNERS
jgi:hypothetical protein